MANKKAAPAKEKKVTDKDYFDEAKSWDESEIVREKKSARRAWSAFWAMTGVVIFQAIAISTMMPLKTIENSIVRVNDTTGETEVISNLKNMDETTEQVMSRYWLAKYLRHREGYHWNTRKDDRLQVGMLSDRAIQQQYADYTNPKVNPYAPIKIYGETTEVDIKVNPAITYLNGKGGMKPEKGEKDQFGETVYTALVRYTATVKKDGEMPVTTHWAATVSFVYRKEPIKVDDRLINPVGFQVISYRKDQEGG